jgi:predicted phosphodiesterase
MEMLGRVDRGVIVLQGGTHLPEGAMVRIVFEPGEASGSARPRRRVAFPLVESDQPGSMKLSGDRIAEILDEDDLAP